MIELTLLAVFTVYISVAILVTRFFIKRAKTRKGKWLKGLATVAIFVLIPTWDAILGTIYFRYLCATEGGVHVYKVVELAPEYWNADGSPAFMDPNGNTDETLFANRFAYRTKVEEKYSGKFNIDKYIDVLLNKDTQEVLGTRTSFLYFGGWLVNSTGFHVNGIRCHGYKADRYQDFFKYIFKPTNPD